VRQEQSGRAHAARAGALEAQLYAATSEAAALGTIKDDAARAMRRLLAQAGSDGDRIVALAGDVADLQNKLAAATAAAGDAAALAEREAAATRALAATTARAAARSAQADELAAALAAAQAALVDERDEKARQEAMAASAQQRAAALDAELTAAIARAAELQAGKQDADDEVRRLRGQLEDGSDSLQAAMDSEAAWRRQAATYESQLEVVNETNRQLARERDAAQKGSEALAAQGMRDGTLIAEQAAKIADLEGLLKAAAGDRDTTSASFKEAAEEVSPTTSPHKLSYPHRTAPHASPTLSSSFSLLPRRRSCGQRWTRRRPRRRRCGGR
jgi:chromosome segregation ATPase